MRSPTVPCCYLAEPDNGGTGAAEAGGSPGQAPEAREHYAVGAFRTAMVVTCLDLNGLLGVLVEDVGPDFTRQELARFAEWAKKALGRLGGWKARRKPAAQPRADWRMGECLGEELDPRRSYAV